MSREGTLCAATWHEPTHVLVLFLLHQSIAYLLGAHARDCGDYFSFKVFLV